MPHRVAAGVLEHLLPVDAGISHESMRARTLRIGEALHADAALEQTTTASAIILSLDSTFIRNCEEDQRHMEVRLGNVEAPSGSRQVFAAVAKIETAIAALIQRSLAKVGQVQETGITAFTDGCSELRSILVDAGVTAPPDLDWFHIAMRLQHAEKTGGSLPADTSERENVEWQGRGCQTHPRAHPGCHAGLPGRTERPKDGSVVTPVPDGAARDRSLSDQPDAGLRVRTSLTEGTANFLVNRRMNKSQQMRWSSRGADLLLQVHCAVVNGKLGSGTGQIFKVKADPVTNLPMAA